ncbi:MAG: hypothetical protein CMD99_03005 [Gammaproteobacteria bacterium]|nr:hypothetical protein [Gammaproteobacteria bacterium]
MSGFVHLLQRLGKQEEIYTPTFVRDTEQIINFVCPIHDYDDLVFIERDYLLLDETIWKDLSDYRDLRLS